MPNRRDFLAAAAAVPFVSLPEFAASAPAQPAAFNPAMQQIGMRSFRLKVLPTKTPPAKPSKILLLRSLDSEAITEIGGCDTAKKYATNLVREERFRIVGDFIQRHPGKDIVYWANWMEAWRIYGCETAGNLCVFCSEMGCPAVWDPRNADLVAWDMIGTEGFPEHIDIDLSRFDPA